MLRKFFLLCFLGNLISCDDMGEPQERISKLRALGVDKGLQSLLVASDLNEEQVSFTVIAAVPTGTEVSASIVEETDETTLSNISISAAPDTREEAGLLDIVGFNATATLSTDLKTLAQSVTDYPLRLRVNILLQSATESELIKTYFLVTKPNGPLTEYISMMSTALSAEITSPSSAPLSEEVEITGVATNAELEDLRVGWFVSSGEITNRRAKNTTWKPESTLQKTLILTMRGRKTGRFGYNVKLYE